MNDKTKEEGLNIKPSINTGEDAQETTTTSTIKPAEDKVATANVINNALKAMDDTDTGEEGDDTVDPECPAVGCVFVFISPVPGSTVVVNGTKARDGLKRDVFSITFSPVGERKPHPIILDCLYTDFGMYVTDDPKLAHVLNKSIAKGNAQYFHYCPTDPAHAQFHPEVYSIATPDMDMLANG